MGCSGKKPCYTLHGEAVTIFRKDCKICWSTEKKRMTETLLYSLLVRHSMIEKIQVLVPALQNITAFPNPVKQIKKQILEMNQFFPVKIIDLESLNLMMYRVNC